jgi:arylsulfatase A-like enzyme
MDALAANGVRMVNAFTPSPVCSPARACFFTGRYPSQHGIHDWLKERDPVIGARDWMAEETNLAAQLSGAGYDTALFGKWHCGRGVHPQPGFDEWFSIGGPQGGHQGPHTYHHNGKAVELDGFKDEIVTDYAVDYIRNRSTAHPMFCFVGHIATHSPWRDHPERIVAPYRDATFADIPNDPAYAHAPPPGKILTPHEKDERELLAQYYASVTHIDEQIGKLLAALDERGMRENTLIVYTSDHGLNFGHHQVWGKGNGTRPLNMLDESIRIPMILSLPSGAKGDHSQEFVDHCDLYQTLLDVAGMEPESAHDGTEYPGRSFAPLLQGQRVSDWRREQFCEYGPARMVRTETHKLLLRHPDGPHELFDLQADPRESTNVYDQPEYAETVVALTLRIENHFAAYDALPTSGLRVAERPRHNSEEAWLMEGWG